MTSIFWGWQPEVQKKRAKRPISRLESYASVLRAVKGRIKMLGGVNLLAYEEWESEKERLDFLTAPGDRSRFG